MMKISKIATAAALAAAALAPGLAQADAIAQSILDISGFSFRVGNGVLGQGALINAGNFNITAVNTADTLANLNGTVVTNGITSANNVLQASCVGACGSYTAFTQLTTNVLNGTYAGSTSSLIGNSLGPVGANARTDNTVSLAPKGDGTAQGNVNLNAVYTLTALNAFSLETSFSAESFLRGYLAAGAMNTPTPFATAAHSWSMAITNNSGAEVFAWSPNGTVGTGITGGTEYADAFNMTRTVTRLTPGSSGGAALTGSFEAESNLFAAGEYTISIRQIGAADAQFELPEPASLGLISLALLGAGFASRRRNAK